MLRDDFFAGSEELLEESLAGVAALEAAGVLSAAEAEAWRDRCRRDAGGDRVARVAATPQQREAAEALLEELLEAGEDGEERFSGALLALRIAGAVDASAWDARMRERYGWPTAEEELAEARELNAGGTNDELVAVLPGPDERRAGRRVLYALRFADGMEIRVDAADREVEDWPVWTLTDDAGTRYHPRGGSDDRVTFRGAPPPEARWVELTLAGDPGATFRIAL